MSTQYDRKMTLVVTEGEKGLDLSEMRVRFKTEQNDVESPTNCSIRVYNLSQQTIKRIRGEFSKVVLQGGYKDAPGVIFQGTIKQFRMGRESGTDTYLDILAADGDQAYNYATVCTTLAAGSTPNDRIREVNKALSPFGVSPGYQMEATGGVLPRGKVLFGMARAAMRQQCASIGASWNISNGQVNVVPLEGYLPGEAVVLSSTTGMVGTPEQTQDGIVVKLLMNPRIQVGGLVQIDNKSINQTVQQDPTGPRVAYNKYAGVQALANVTSDGLYRAIVVEHEGDSRGQAWYTTLVCLALDTDTKKVRVP